MGLLPSKTKPADVVAKKLTEIRKRLQEEIIYNPQIDIQTRVASYMFDIYLEDMERARYAEALEGIEKTQSKN